MNNKIRLVAAIIGLAVIITVVVMITDSKDSTLDGYYSVSQTKWPNNKFTKNIPKFDGDIYSVLVNDSSTAVFIRNVELNTLDEYVEKFSEHNIVLNGDGYPKKAELEDVFITLAYNSQDKNFSVTLSLKEESSQ